uniref:PHD-type domain-containing protein n=1 Tax=Anopheles farauti TaxID=69004 RepID=A0A182Q586_9DIPT
MSKVCYLCKSKADDELLYGKFYTKWKITVHYYCLLLSSNLVQNGVNDTVGIFGFLEQDIRRENERTKKSRCYICKKPHANVSCCAKKCLRTFHTVCGIQNRCLSHYTDTFQSWCASHVPLKSEAKPHAPDEPCSICYDEMGPYEKISSIRAPCCKNGWFHQQCLARYAQTAGYFFKCPLCKNEDTFLAEIPLRGVFVPERDAAWELEPNAFQEQLIRPTACDAEKCKCQEGRTKDNHQWRLVVCGSCGSTCRHRQCMEQQISSRTYVCQLCKPIVGDRLVAGDDSSDDSEDDAGSISTESSVSLGMTSNKDGPGSGESGVHCSSSDEILANIQRLSKRRFRIVSSDSERSDSSSSQIRRCVRQNTGKRVRRIVTDESDVDSASAQSEPTSLPMKSETASCVKQLDENSNAPSPSPISAERSPVKEEDDIFRTSEASIFNAERRHTRQWYRLHSEDSEDSNRKRRNSDSSIEPVEPKRLRTCRSSRIISSSDESDKTSSEHELGEKETASIAVRHPVSQTRLEESGSKVNSLKPASESSGSSSEKSITDTLVSAPATGKRLRRQIHDSDSSDESYNSPIRKRRCISSAQYISPPSTPPSMTSDASQPSVGVSASVTNEKAEGKVTPPSNTKQLTPNQVQQSMLHFVTFSDRRRISDGSADETASPASCSRAPPTITRNSAISRKRRRKTNSPKQQTSSKSGDGGESSSPTAAPSAHKPHRKQNHIMEKKAKGQKNILSYFNRC